MKRNKLQSLQSTYIVKESKISKFIFFFQIKKTIYVLKLGEVINVNIYHFNWKNTLSFDSNRSPINHYLCYWDMNYRYT